MITTRTPLNAVVLIGLFSVTSTSPVAGQAGKRRPWLDHYYQYRIRVEIQADRPGWQIIPLTERDITASLNEIEEMRFDPAFFGYNHFKAVETRPDGTSADLGERAGFFLIPDGEPLLQTGGPDGPKEIRTPTEAGAYYLLQYVCQGGKEPLNPYVPVFMPGDKDRTHLHLASYEPALLPKGKRRQEVLIQSDGGPLTFTLRAKHINQPESCSLRKVKIVFLANFDEPGKRRLDLYYQPTGAHFLAIPRLRRPTLPTASARLLNTGKAEKFVGDTRYRVVANDAVEVWFAETTVKLTPNTPPPADSRTAVRVAAAANEKQSFQLVLRPRRPFPFKGAKASALLKGARAIAADRVDIRQVDYVPIKKSSFITPVRYQGLIGDALIPVSPQILWQSDGNLALWATVQTAADQAPGIYKGAIEIDCGPRPPLRIPLAVEVYDFALPEYSPLQANLGGKFFHIKSDPKSRRMTAYHGIADNDAAAARKLAARHYDVMAANKFMPYNVASYVAGGLRWKWDPPQQGYNRDGPGNFFRLYGWDFTEYNKALERYIDEMKVNSICIEHTNPNVCNQFSLPAGSEPAGGAAAQPYSRSRTNVAWDKQPGDPKDLVEITPAQFDRLILDFFRAVAENLDEHGWLERAHIMVDETHNDKRLLHYLRVLKSDPLTARIRIVCCVQGLTYFTNPAYKGLVDTYMPQIDENYNRWEPHYFSDYGLAPDWRRLGCYVVVSSRTCIDSTGMSNRGLGLDLFRRGASFFHIWETAHYGTCDANWRYSPAANPWQNPATPWGNGALSFFYPPQRRGFPDAPDFTVTPSLRIMTYREAVDDYEYARMLKDLAAEAKRRGIEPKEASAILADIDRFFDSNVNWSQNDSWYLRLRHRMARAIVRLK